MPSEEEEWRQVRDELWKIGERVNKINESATHKMRLKVSYTFTPPLV